MKVVGGKWSNWSGAVSWKPQEILAPTDEVALAAAMRASERTVRAPGSGHSFTPLCQTDGLLVDLSAFAGVREVSQDKSLATIGAGTPLWALGAALHAQGAGLCNMGDIDRQTLGGVVGTATHGTGITLGSLSSEVRGFRLILASGELINCSSNENSDVFRAGAVSLGTLGLMTDITIAVRPAYKLVENNFLLPHDELFRRLDELVSNNRHFEFFWFPYADAAVCKTLNETDVAASAPRNPEALRRRGERVGFESRAFAAVNEVLPFAPFLLGSAHALFSRLMPGPPGARWSHEAFPSPRPIRFNEMEYAVPFAQGADCVREIVEMIRKRRINTGFPLEFRTVAADDAWLSPFYRRTSATIAVHQYHRVDATRLFNACEAIFGTYAGRPHWGKCHTRSRDALAGLYPEFDRFRETRRTLDPSGKMLNDYLRPIFA